MNIKYRPEIDGLRALAVLPVILFHAGIKRFSGGFVGVDVFFVISGFLITSIIVADLKNGVFSFGKFYERRARRILPALLVMVACCIPFAWMWMLPLELKSFAASVMDVNIFASNILFWHESGYFDHAAELKPLLHTWSLAVEEQYYVVFPMLVVFLWRFGRRGTIWAIALLAFASLALSQYTSEAAPTFGFYWLPTRAWELLAGSLSSFVAVRNAPARDNVLSIAGLAAIVVSVFCFDRTTPTPSIYSLLPVGGACLVLLFAKTETLTGKILSMRPLVGIGLMSYSAYLWHQPLLAFARIRLMGELSGPQLAAILALTFLLAYISWRFIEMPIRTKNSSIISRKSVAIGIAAVLSISITTFGVAGELNGGFPERLSQEATSILKQGDDSNPRMWDCRAGQGTSLIPSTACTYGDKSNVKIALLGDSHADALAFELGSRLEPYKLGFREITHTSCPPIGSYNVKLGLDFNDCASFHNLVVEFLMQHAEIKTVILFARWTRYIEMVPFDNGEGGRELGLDFIPIIDGKSQSKTNEVQQRIGYLYQESVQQLLNMGKNVVLIYPQPEVGWDAPAFLAEANLLGIKVSRPLSTSYQRFKDRSRLAYESLDAIGDHPHLIRVKPEMIFCDTFVKQRCAVEDGNALFYSDNNHPSANGASLIAQAVSDALKANGLQ